MTNEIELKYQVLDTNKKNTNIAEKISVLLSDQNMTFEENQNHLANQYFDNNELDLRKMDFGLRIRTTNNQYEQTIKTAGIVKNGLHQRPEYNIDIPKNKLDLLLFPHKIWPKNLNIAALMKSLKVIFSTDFHRHSWLISHNGSVIELALDTGKISTSLSDSTQIINEIEIELVSGNEKELFVIAKKLMNIVAMKPSDLSKAKRGYELFKEAMNK